MAFKDHQKSIYYTTSYTQPSDSGSKRKFSSHSGSIDSIYHRLHHHALTSLRNSKKRNYLPSPLCCATRRRKFIERKDKKTSALDRVYENILTSFHIIYHSAPRIKRDAALASENATNKDRSAMCGQISWRNESKFQQISLNVSSWARRKKYRIHSDRLSPLCHAPKDY